MENWCVYVEEKKYVYVEEKKVCIFIKKMCMYIKDVYMYIDASGFECNISFSRILRHGAIMRQSVIMKLYIFHIYISM